MNPARALGRVVGRALGGLGIRAFRDWMSGGKGKDEPPAPPAVQPGAGVAKMAVIVLAAVVSACAFAKEFGIGVGEGIVDCVRRPDLCAPRPTPTPDCPRGAADGGGACERRGGRGDRGRVVRARVRTCQVGRVDAVTVAATERCTWCRVEVRTATSASTAPPLCPVCADLCARMYIDMAAMGVRGFRATEFRIGVLAR